MQKSMTWNKRITKILRNWHRDIGYFVVAISLVYGISGILLTHKNAFPVISTIETRETFSPQLSISNFAQQWSQAHPDLELTKCFNGTGSIKFYYDGGKGQYKLETGLLAYESYKKHSFIAFFTDLHFNQKQGWKYIADLYCVGLIFLAISGLAMVKGKNGFKKRGVWFMVSGMLIVVLFLFI
jgi:hypothetical protein